MFVTLKDKLNESVANFWACSIGVVEIFNLFAVQENAAL